MTSTSKHARMAGLLYLLLIIAAPVRLIYIPSALFVSGNAALTASNIAAHDMLFRFGIVADLLSGTIGLFLTFALFRLLKGVSRNLAIGMVALGVMPDIIYFFNVLNDFAALTLAHGADFLSAFSTPQRDALAMLFLHLHGQEIAAAEIFWGLWLFPLAMLVYRSRFLPRFLGVWLAINGVAYLVLSFTGLLLPSFEDTVAAIAFPAQLGEVAFMLWILLLGAKHSAAAASVS